MRENRSTLPQDDLWVIRVVSDACRYRLELSPYDSYQKVLDLIIQKTGFDPLCLEVCNSSGKRLNIQPQRRLKDVVYLNHGSILFVKEVEGLKNSAFKSRASFLSADSKITTKDVTSPPKKLFSPQKSKCTHPPSGKCLQCMQQPLKNQNQTAGNLSSKLVEKTETYSSCNHGPNMKCLKCLDKPQKLVEKVKQPQKATISAISPRKNQVNNPEESNIKCRHSSKITCPLCVATPQKISKIVLINPEKSPKSSKVTTPTPNNQKQTKQDSKPKQVKKCDHGPMGKCLNCITTQKDEKKEQKSQLCDHSPQAKCLKCVARQASKPAHLPFDQYLNTRHLNCQHTKENTCPNCLPPKNLRLKIDKKCKNHPPYPKALCTSCMPQNVTIKRQEYRHVDYVQFMNHTQIQNFIDYWLKEKGKAEMRVGFLYGYYCEDPFYKNGIRAVVQVLYQPHQKCTDKLFWITDTMQRRNELEMIIESLGLEKIGMIMTSNNHEMPFNDSYIRFLAKMQEEMAVSHSSGYRLSNMFTMVISEKISNGVATIEPEIYMVSDQGQALQAANLFISNKENPNKMKIKEQVVGDQLLPSVYLNGKKVNEFEIEFLLVKIAAGRDKSTKFAIMKGNEFPTSSRGPVKGRKLKEFIAKARRMPINTRFGDLNLLIFVAETLGFETAMELGMKVADQIPIQEEMWILVEKELSKYV